MYSVVLLDPNSNPAPGERCVQTAAHCASRLSPACVSRVMEATNQSKLLHARLASSWKSRMWKANTRKNALQ